MPLHGDSRDQALPSKVHTMALSGLRRAGYGVVPVAYQQQEPMQAGPMQGRRCKDR